jgi:hypothetical protein
MSNQIFLWSLLIFPWFTVFFMTREAVKRFMPAALLATIISIIVVEVGVTLEWWIVKESAYPLRSPANIFSLNPLITMWLLRFTYGRFWLYIAIDVLANLGFSYWFIGYVLSRRDIIQYLEFGPLHVFLITTVTGIVIYVYQKWQEGIFYKLYKNRLRLD